jgi:hypothetical protein
MSATSASVIIRVVAQDSWLRDHPSIARGDAPVGTWELKADHQKDAVGDDLRLFINFQRDDGQPIGGFGCRGVGLANDSRPIVISVSGDRPDGSFCYVGQAVSSTTRVEVELSDGTAADATLIQSDLPIIVWIAFTDEHTQPNEIRGFAADDLLGREPVNEDIPRASGSSVWGPIDWVT